MIGNSFPGVTIQFFLFVCSVNTSRNSACERESFPSGGLTAKIKDLPSLSEPCILPELSLVELQYANSNSICISLIESFEHPSDGSNAGSHTNTKKKMVPDWEITKFMQEKDLQGCKNQWEWKGSQKSTQVAYICCNRGVL